MRFRHGALAGLLLSVLPSTIARAGSTGSPGRWEFDRPGDDVLAAQHAGQSLNELVVVPAGEPRHLVSKAARLTARAYARSGVARRVHGAEILARDPELQQLDDADDATIVERVRTLGPSHIAIVRLAPGATARRAEAMVTIYDRTGKVTGLLSLKLHQAGAADRGAADRGAAPPAEDPPGRAAPPRRRPDRARADARRRYAEQRVWFADDSSPTTSKWHLTTQAVQGTDQKPLTGAEFYRVVGRSDLATRYERRATTRLALLTGGAALGLGGIGYSSFSLARRCDDEYHYGEQCYNEREPHFWLGVGITAAGGITMAVAYLINPHPVSAADARLLAAEHNTRLRQELGLDDDEANREGRGERAGAQHRPVLLPVALERGAGLALSGSF